MWWGGGEKVAVEGRLRQYYSSSFGPIDIAYIQGLLGFGWGLPGGGLGSPWVWFRLSCWRPNLKRPPSKAALNVME